MICVKKEGKVVYKKNVHEKDVNVVRPRIVQENA